MTGCYYHVTSEGAVWSHLAAGYRDATGLYLTSDEHTGVWLSDRPLDINEGIEGDVLLVVDIAAELVTPYEWVEEGKPYREFLVPAPVLNAHGRVRRAKAEAG